MARERRTRTARLLEICLACLFALPAAASDLPEVTIGLVDTFSPEFYIGTYAPTLDHLIETLPQYRFRVVEIDYRQVEKDIERLRPAFLVTSASTYVSLIESAGAHQVATKKPGRSADVSRTVASAFVVKSSSPLKTLADLRGKKAAVSSLESFDGWIIAQGEIARAFSDAEGFFSEVLATDYGIPDVALLVKMGMADAGVLGTCELEHLVATGQIAPHDFRVIGEKTTEGACVRSTGLYPDVVFSALPGVDAEVTRNVTVALLSMPGKGLDFTWTIANDFVPTYELLKSLRLGPYRPLPWTAKLLWRTYRTEILLALGLLLAVAFHIVTVNLLVQKRTQELAESLEETRHFYKKAEETRSELLRLERTQIVSQLSSLFAHEIKQPIMNMALYAGALRMLLQKEGHLSEKAEGILGKLSGEVERSSEIVEHVRGYAKKKASKKIPCDLERIARESLEVNAAGLAIGMKAKSPALVLGDPFELQFIVDNFVKNARAAASAAPNPAVSVELFDEGPRLRLTVSDNGPALSDEAFARLGKAGRSTKAEGLGFGLSIALGLAEKMGGHIAFERRAQGGLAVSLVLGRFSDLPADSKESSA